MSTTLDQFRGKSWSEVVVRQKIKPNEILLSEDNSYDLVRCRQCKRVVKSGFVDIHSKKCKQYQASLPVNSSINSKINMATYYYHVSPIDNNTNPELNPNKRINEPPHKKRKVNNKNTDTKNTNPTLILPTSITKHNNNNNNNNNKSSIYNDLYRGLKPYTNKANTPIATSKPKSQKKKLKLRLSRSRINGKNNKTNNTQNNTVNNNGNGNGNDSTQMMNNQMIKEEKEENRGDREIRRRHRRFGLTAWEREEEIINDNIKQECSLSYIGCNHVYNAYAKTIDKYSQEYSTRGNTPWTKYYDKEISKMNSNYMARPIIKSILNRKNYTKENGRQYEEFMALEDIVGISYNIPKKFSNGIIPPHEIVNNNGSISLKAFIEERKLQQHIARDENDFYMKELPYSPFKYVNSQLHNKVCKIQLNIWKNKQIAHVLRIRKEADKRKAMQPAQPSPIHHNAQRYNIHTPGQPPPPPHIPVPVPYRNPLRNGHATPHHPSNGGISRTHPSTHHTQYKTYMNGHPQMAPRPTYGNPSRNNNHGRAVNALAISRSRYNGILNNISVPPPTDTMSINSNNTIPILPRTSSYSSGNSVTTQNTMASMGSRVSYRSHAHGHIPVNHNHNHVPPPVPVPVPSIPVPVPVAAPSVNMGNGRSSVGPPPQAQYPSYPPPTTVPSPFVNSGRSSVGPPPGILRRNESIQTQQSHQNGGGGNGSVYRGGYNRGNNNNNNRRSVNNMGMVSVGGIRPPRYDNPSSINNMSINDNNGSHYNASPSDTQITNISALTQQPAPIPLTNQTHLSVNNNNGNGNNNNNNVSPQSINSTHTNYTGVSQHSNHTQMTYNSRGNGHVNGIPLQTNTNQPHRLYHNGPPPPQLGMVPTPTELLRNPTTENEMFMPSIGC